MCCEKLAVGSWEWKQRLPLLYAASYIFLCVFSVRRAPPPEASAAGGSYSVGGMWFKKLGLTEASGGLN